MPQGCNLRKRKMYTFGYYSCSFMYTFPKLKPSSLDERSWSRTHKRVPFISKRVTNPGSAGRTHQKRLKDDAALMAKEVKTMKKRENAWNCSAGQEITVDTKDEVIGENCSGAAFFRRGNVALHQRNIDADPRVSAMLPRCCTAFSHSISASWTPCTATLHQPDLDVHDPLGRSSLLKCVLHLFPNIVSLFLVGLSSASCMLEASLLVCKPAAQGLNSGCSVTDESPLLSSQSPLCQHVRPAVVFSGRPVSSIAHLG